MAICRLLNIGKGRVKAIHCPDIRSLPRYMRLLHPKAHKHLCAVLIGAALMLTGSAIAGHKQMLWSFLPETVWDTVGYLIHGIGSLPILGHFEPLWRLLRDGAA